MLFVLLESTPRVQTSAKADSTIHTSCNALFSIGEWDKWHH